MPAKVSTELLAQRVRRLRGWRRRGVAFAAGAASVLAMPPSFAWPVLWVTLPLLVWLIDGVTWGVTWGATWHGAASAAPPSPMPSPGARSDRPSDRLSDVHSEGARAQEPRR